MIYISGNNGIAYQYLKEVCYTLSEEVYRKNIVSLTLTFRGQAVVLAHNSVNMASQGQPYRA